MELYSQDVLYQECLQVIFMEMMLILPDSYKSTGYEQQSKVIFSFRQILKM